MRFIASFGRSNTFSMDIVPVSNEEHVKALVKAKKDVPEYDLQQAIHHPLAAHFAATLAKARELCEGATVLFA